MMKLKLDIQDFEKKLDELIKQGVEICNVQITPTKDFGIVRATGTHHRVYAKEDADNFMAKIKGWEKLVKSFLQISFESDWDNLPGERNEYVKEFDRAGEISIKPMDIIGDGKRNVRNSIECLESIMQREKMAAELKSSGIENGMNIQSKNVFIVHGHDSALKLNVARTLEKLGLSPTILHEIPNKGNTIIEKLEDAAMHCSFAIILLTADDIGRSKTEKELKPRSRQNVIFEHGYFIAKLGRDRTMCILDKDVEKPGDLDGVVYVESVSDLEWQMKLVQELKAAGFNVSADSLIH